MLPRCACVLARAVELMTHGHVDDEVPNACQLEVLDHEVCLPESAAVGHVLAVGFVSLHCE
jgi:hypothetical protein